MNNRLAACLVACAVTVLGGCAAGPDAGPPRAVVLGFFQAVQAGQGARACALLAPEAAADFDDAGGCARAVVGLGLRGGAVREVAVWGDEAQVRLSGDTVFLHRFTGGWRIRGAGCRPDPPRPYDCEVET